MELKRWISVVYVEVIMSVSIVLEYLMVIHKEMSVANVEVLVKITVVIVEEEIQSRVI
jgi:hypothetical protein